MGPSSKPAESASYFTTDLLATLSFSAAVGIAKKAGKWEYYTYLLTMNRRSERSLKIM